MHLDANDSRLDLTFWTIPLARLGIRGTEREERSKTQGRHGFLTTGQVQVNHVVLSDVIMMTLLRSACRPVVFN